MVMTIKTDSGYLVQFPNDLEMSEDKILVSPARGDHVAIPYTIRGEPGLLDVRFCFRKIGDTKRDVFIESFSAVLRPAGWFTNFKGRSGAEMAREMTVPKRLFPIEVDSIEIKNLSSAAWSK